MPASEAEVFIVDEAQSGTRLDAYLGAVLRSRSQAQYLIKEKQVQVNGIERQKRYLLTAGDQVQVMLTSDASEDRTVLVDQSELFKIVFQDEYLLVVDKAAGVVVHPARGHSSGTLVQELGGLVAGGSDPERPGVLHRLDKDTSGLLILARSDQVLSALQEELNQRTLERYYLTLVEGQLDSLAGRIDAPLGRSRHNRFLISIDTNAPKRAVTHFTTRERFLEETLLEVKLETGRTHQIRAHFQAIGHPVIGDTAYGGSAKYELFRQFLHAHRLVFTHPISKEKIELASQLPPDLAKVVEDLQEVKSSQAALRTQSP